MCIKYAHYSFHFAYLKFLLPNIVKKKKEAEQMNEQ